MKINRFLTIAASFALSTTMLCTPVLEAYAEGYPFRTTCDYYYDQFDSGAQKLYDDLLSVAKMMDDSDETYIKSPEIYYQNIDSEELRDLMTMFAFVHPEFFWVSNRYSYGYHGNQNYVQLEVFAPFQDGAARKKAKAEILAAEQAYIDGAMQYDTDYDRAEYLSTNLKADVKYGSVNGNLDQSLASTFLYHQTVCAGFTKAYTLLANAVGVDTVALRSASHAWNATKIADNWYVDDVTNGLFLYCDKQIDAFDQKQGVVTITYSDGTQKNTLMHEKEYYYFTDIFPDTSKAYDGSSKVLSNVTEPTEPGTEPATEPDTEPATEPDTEPATEPDTEPATEPATSSGDSKYVIQSKTHYFMADDTEVMDPAELVSSISKVIASYGNYTFKTEIDPGSLILADGWDTPAEILQKQAAGKSYYHGSIPAFVDGEVVMIGDVWIIRRGDMTMDGIVNAKDASMILVSAASVGAGMGPKGAPGTDAKASIFAGKFLKDEGSYPNAKDASAVLVYAAKVGVGIG